MDSTEQLKATEGEEEPRLSVKEVIERSNRQNERNKKLIRIIPDVELR